MVKETPFSAYVTIRKKFMKNLNVDDLVTITQPEALESDETKKLEKQVLDLKQKIEFIYSENGHLKLELEEFEVKNEALEDDKESVQTSLDNLIEENEALRTNLDELQTGLTEIFNEKEVFKKQLLKGMRIKSL